MYLVEYCQICFSVPFSFTQVGEYAALKIAYSSKNGGGSAGSFGVTGRARDVPSVEVLAEDPGVVARRGVPQIGLERLFLLRGGLARPELRAVGVRDPVVVRVLPGEDRRPAGQHHGVFATPLGKKLPPWKEPAPSLPPVRNHSFVFGMTAIVPSRRWSSVTITHVRRRRCEPTCGVAHSAASTTKSGKIRNDGTAESPPCGGPL